MSYLDEQGGVVPEDQYQAERAADADLVTLPENVEGTNCGNCMYMKRYFCEHEKVLQDVNERMCCGYWDAAGTLRSWE